MLDHLIIQSLIEVPPRLGVDSSLVAGVVTRAVVFDSLILIGGAATYGTAIARVFDGGVAEGVAGIDGFTHGTARKRISKTGVIL